VSRDASIPPIGLYAVKCQFCRFPLLAKEVIYLRKKGGTILARQGSYRLKVFDLQRNCCVLPGAADFIIYVMEQTYFEHVLKNNHYTKLIHILIHVCILHPN
jgi:hypothetical protein